MAGVPPPLPLLVLQPLPQRQARIAQGYYEVHRELVKRHHLEMMPDAATPQPRPPAVWYFYPVQGPSDPVPRRTRPGEDPRSMTEGIAYHFQVPEKLPLSK